MIHRIYFILLLLSLSFTAKAQLGKELILNGGFEEYAKVTPPPSGEDDEEDEEEEAEISQCLIELTWMAWILVFANEDKCPRHIGYLADNL